MVADNWFSEIESTIFTYLKYVLVEEDEARFKDLNCTTSSESESIENIVDFPTLYIHLLPLVELGNDLYNTDVAAVRATVELQVITDKSEASCRKIMDACILAMKQLRFNIPMFPDPQTSNKKYFAIARFTRVIASGDSDIVQKV